MALLLLMYVVLCLACDTDWDCQLNGACVSGSCVCDRGWNGDDCGDLNIDSGKAIYGSGATPDTSAWGGGPPVYDDETKEFHLFATEIAGNCGMSTWGRMSQAAHLTGPSLDGPYKKVDVAVQTQTHNVLYAYSPVDKMHLIYSIFSGTNPSSCNPYYKCTNGTTPGAHGLRPPSGPWPPPTCPIQGGAHLHSSRSLNGPWTSAGRLNTTAPPLSKCNPELCSPTDGWKGCCAGSSNPAPYIFPNGTVLLLGRSPDAHRAGKGLHIYQNIWLYRASSWNSTYEWVDAGGANGSLPFANSAAHLLTEDPVLYRGRRGFHVILHSHPGLTHAWSRDGLTWEWSPHVTGPPMDGGDHERPRVVLDPNGDLDALFVSHMPSSQDSEDASALMIFRPKK